MPVYLLCLCEFNLFCGLEVSTFSMFCRWLGEKCHYQYYIPSVKFLSLQWILEPGYKLKEDLIKDVEEILEKKSSIEIYYLLFFNTPFVF